MKDSHPMIKAIDEKEIELSKIDEHTCSLACSLTRKRGTNTVQTNFPLTGLDSMVQQKLLQSKQHSTLAALDIFISQAAYFIDSSWAREGTIQAWLLANREIYLAALPEPQRTAIKNIALARAQYAALFFHELQKRTKQSNESK
jgi:hypothetical protein